MKKTNVHFILDKSGSMENVKTATIGGFNEYISTLKKDKADYNVSLTLFDTVVNLNPVVPIKEMKELTSKEYVPNGMTALYDAVCSTLKSVKQTKNKDKNLVVIMTDGEENSSKEYTMESLKAMIAEKEKEGNWTFIFLGANQDAWLNAQKIGFSQGNVATYNSSTAGVGAVMRCMAVNTAAFSAQSAGETKTYFSAQDKDALQKTK